MIEKSETSTDSDSSWRVNNEDLNENLEELSEEWAHLLEDTHSQT